jgi:hypothetical protein
LVEDHDCRRSHDFEFLKDRIAELFSSCRPEKDEVRVQEFLVFCVCEELLTQQYAAPSATGVKVDQNLFAFGLGLAEGFLKVSLEPVLRGS